MEKRVVAVLVLVAAGGYLLAGTVLDSTDRPAVREGAPDEELVQPAPNGSYLWPYTSASRSVEDRTLAVNVVVRGEDDRVRRTLTDRTALAWDETAPEERDAEVDDADHLVVEGAPVWDDAEGSVRYTYVDAGPHGGEARWIDETYQLHVGAYFGERHHIRAYTTDADDWTAIQIHQEYYDWFTLRHTVTDIIDARNVLEEAFLDQPFVEDLRREHHGVDEGWNDGWITVVQLAAAVPVAGLALMGLSNVFRAETRRSMRREVRRFGSWSVRNLRGFILVGFLIAVVLGVRTTGIVLESLVADVHPHAIAAVLYPVIAVTPPSIAIALCRPLDRPSRFAVVERLVHQLGRPLEPLAAGGFAALGLGLAFLLEFGAHGVAALPLELIVHRVGLLAALGVVGAGAARGGAEGGGLLSIGAIAWLVGLFLPLVGWI